MHHGENLRKFLAEEEFSVQGFSELAITPSRATINRDLTNFEIPLKKRLLYAHALNIHVDSFDEGKMISLNKGLAEIISISLVPKRDYHEYLKLYFQTIGKEIAKVQSSITIVDYIKNNFQSANDYLLSEYSETYHGLYADYLQQIEKRLLLLKQNNQKIQYNRFYQTPLGDIRKEVFGGDKILCGVDMIYSETIKHFIRLWKAGIEAKMFLLPKAVRPTSYMLIDDQMILSEYVKYDKDGFSRPDILFVDRKQSSTDTTSIPARLIETYQYEMSARNLPPESRIKLTPELMIDYLRDILICYERVANGAKVSASNQDKIEFYKGRIGNTEEKIELLESFIKED